eukprot:TRINITY_DN3004_c0_g1_i1.p1 TRINITY_DN3004_c0_g1~~TRINITY_DN3004_c0_g1_i1.p1  ORF type:complete len:755 (-),score=217.90 TRINITY_DN3004_c0_g1_i1:117-2381(-)
MSGEGEENEVQRIFIVSNRLYESEPQGPGTVGLLNNCVTSAGRSLESQGKKVIWVGHDSSFDQSISEGEVDEKTREIFERDGRIPIFLKKEDEKGWYSYGSNVLWALFHYYGSSGLHDLDAPTWSTFLKVNQLFADTLGKYVRKGDVVMIQAYQLMVLPKYLREMVCKDVLISYFFHIPFPSSELYRGLPSRKEILEGVLGSDLIGFQTFAYARHFKSCCAAILGHTLTDKGVWVDEERFVRLDAFPAGIDPNNVLSQLDKPEVKSRIAELKETYKDKKIIVCRDRMEYIKGVPHKLMAFQMFLERYPEWIGKAVMILMCSVNSSVLEEDEHQELKEEIDRAVGRVNGKFGTVQYMPVHYLNRAINWEEVVSIFAIADAGLITPLRDGMNLTCHEFLCAQVEKKSPLILSEFAGAAQCLSGTILVNPWDYKRVSKAILEAFTMSESQKNVRFRHSHEYVKTHNSQFWINSILAEVDLMKLSAPKLQNEDQITPKAKFKSIVDAYSKSTKRLLLLDYDGTLSPLASLPEHAVPTPKLLNLLNDLSRGTETYVYVISGRDRRSLGEWLGTLPIGLSCEHGLFFRTCVKDEISEWQDILEEMDLSWKSDIKAIFDDFKDRTPGAFVEVKEVNVTWHYRNADPEYGEIQKNQLLSHLHSIPGLPIDILVGKKAVEVRPRGINKGSVVRRIMTVDRDFDFVMCIGDDVTDEDMFEEIRRYDGIDHCFTIMVDKKPTGASCYVREQSDVITLLDMMTSSH